MFYVGLFVGAIVGGAIGWAITYLKFRGINKALQAKISAAAASIAEKV
jgi:hypothetical protein